MYRVKTMLDGKVGVYDTLTASFPTETDDLRAAGVGRVEWFTGKGAEAEATRIADVLNDFHGHARVGDQ